MEIARVVTDLAAIRSNWGGRATVALVPTMGALHAGHLSLVAAARAACDRVVVSIFVNPLQFGDAGDLARYPRDEAGDLAQLRDAGTDAVWLPELSTMYPPQDATAIEVGGPALGFEGAHRPGHFRGVATVVAKLIGQIGPSDAFFGEKDWQQLQVVRRMTADLALPVRIRGVAIAREADGLAMSSRNRFLSAPQRAAAPALYRALHDAAGAIDRGALVADAVDAARAELTRRGLVPDYVALVEGNTLAALTAPTDGARLMAAARLGAVRLLDNIPLH